MASPPPSQSSHPVSTFSSSSPKSPTPPIPSAKLSASGSSKKSFSSLLSGSASKQPLNDLDDAKAPSRSEDEKEKTGKVKGLLNRLRSNSSSSKLGESGKPVLDKPKSDSSLSTSASKNHYLGPSTLKPSLAASNYSSSDDETEMPNDPFRLAVARAESSVDRLETLQLVVGGIVGIAELGAGWIPGVGKGVAVVGQMLLRAQEIAVGRVAALRLVERSANVLCAVQQAVIDNRGHVSPVMRSNISRLLVNLDDSAYLLTKLSQRSFLKLYLHADETQRNIDKASDDLMDTIAIFQIQSHISSAAWQEESRADHEKDLDLLLKKQEAARKDDQELLMLLGLKSEQQQEAIKTLQRTLDSLLAYQAKSTVPTSRPASPAEMESTMMMSLPPVARMRLNSLGPDSSESESASLAATPRARSMSMAEDIDEHKQFCEHALNVLRRHSDSTDVGVPDWTITSLEISHGPRISSGFFSVVWKGTWQDQTIAIKELNHTASRTLFINEVNVWRQLRSEYILPFFGASSTTGPPPWFLISPFMQNGDILTYLKSETGSHADRFALVHQAAMGMEYLHEREILHGDLKARNILITDVGTAVLCDFGLSHLKIDIVTRSQSDPAVQHALGGTMRWQSPLRLAGEPLSYACDVYSFGMTLYEVFTGQIPFGYVDDYALREAIKQGERPKRPSGLGDDIWQLMTECWHQKPEKRPSFDEICTRLARMYNVPERLRKGTDHTITGSSTSSSSYTTADEGEVQEEHQQVLSPQNDTIDLPDIDETSSSSGSIHSIPPHLEKELSFDSDRAERHYRHYLQHDFDDRLTLPLWFPSRIALGSVGYIRHGQFIKLLDAVRPPMDKKELPPMPFMSQFGHLQTTRTPVKVRSAAEKGLDYVSAITSSFTRSSGETFQQGVVRRVTYPLKPGNKQAVLLIDDGEFEIYESLAFAQQYLKANVDWIVEHYGESHHIDRERVILVVGALRARYYTMLVSNFAPRTTLTFNVHSTVNEGQPWGTWTVNKAGAPKKGVSGVSAASGNYGNEKGEVHAGAEGRMSGRGEEQTLKYTAKVSQGGGGEKDSVMLVKLKIPPGGGEPALYS